jgi:CheY-like chemotaxis protein
VQSVARLTLGHARVRVTKRILLADDDLGVREMLGRVLESEGYRVVFAKTGGEAVAQYRTDPPDLVLLDLNMPVMDGWAAFRLINAYDLMRPVVVITARHNQYSQADELGADALMEKPLNLALLLETIRNLLAETASERTRRLNDPNFKTVLLD